MFEDYIKSNTTMEEQCFTFSFYEKFEALKSLYDKSKSFNGSLRCDGKYNSNICFVFKNREHYKELLPNLQKLFGIYGIKSYEIVILFLDKYESYPDNLSILISEISIIDPKIVYCFDYDYIEKDICDNSDIDTNIVTIMNFSQFLCMKTSPEIFDCFKYLITYNY